MNRPLLVPDLTLPAPASDPGEIPAPRDGLVRAGRADDRRVILAGVRSRVTISGLDGVHEIAAGGAIVTGAIHLAAPPAANVLASPRTLVRERIGAGGALRETLVVPERLPGAVVQWAGDAPPDGWVLDVELPLGDRPETPVRVEGTLLRWVTGPEGAGGVLQLLGPVDETGWTLVVDQGRPRARAVLHPRPDRPVTLLATAVDDDRRLPSLPALGAVSAHRRRDALEPDDAPGLVVRTGVAEIDDGVAWARAALRARLVDRGGELRVRGGDPSDLVRGALAAGEVAVARAALESLDSRAPDRAEAEARALWVAWTAEPGPLLEARSRLDPVLADAPTSLRGRVADAAEAAGDDGWAADLRRPVAREGSDGRRLPTLGGEPDDGGPSPEPLLEFGEGRPDADTLRRALARTCADTSDWGVAALRRALAAISRHGPDVLRPEAALTLDLLVRGLLGVHPDAAYGRVRMGPCFPASWTSFRAEGLQMGDARLAIEMEREGPLTRLVLRQTAGGAPVTWIVEPRLIGETLSAARVDGRPAEIDVERVAGRLRPRLQVPGERERVVELEVSPP